jgi:hypothetical protein
MQIRAVTSFGSTGAAWTSSPPYACGGEDISDAILRLATSGP